MTTNSESPKLWHLLLTGFGIAAGTAIFELIRESMKKKQRKRYFNPDSDGKVVYLQAEGEE